MRKHKYAARDSPEKDEIEIERSKLVFLIEQISIPDIYFSTGMLQIVSLCNSVFVTKSIPTYVATTTSSNSIVATKYLPVTPPVSFQYNVSYFSFKSLVSTRSVVGMISMPMIPTAFRKIACMMQTRLLH